MEHKEIMEKDKLNSESQIYNIDSKTYDLFSKAEDSNNKIVNFLSEKVKDKIVLDFGCGTGKFLPTLVPLSKKYVGMDISENQLKIAKEKSKNYGNVELIKNSITEIPLESNSIDLIFSSWVIGSIHDLKLRKEIIEEMKRVVNEGGPIYLIENDVNGEYKDIVEEGYGNEKTMKKLKWLEENGFRKITSFRTCFEFENLESAKRIFESIFGKEISSKIKNKKIGHNIIIYKNEK